VFEFACAALRGAGLDPTRDVRFITLPGTPLDATRMAAAVRDREVDAIWQLDVLTGFLEGEGVVVRALPSGLIDLLTPSSCVEALDQTLAERPDAFGAFGRALAKATLFTITNPAAAIALMWQRYPDAAPRPGEDTARANRRELAALEVRIRGHRIEQAPLPRWGAITAPEISAWQDFLLSTGAIKRRRPPRDYFSDALVDAFNAFDPAPIIAAARATA
jgi:NitT/TauT family transport system substrate-binding protein